MAENAASRTLVRHPPKMPDPDDDQTLVARCRQGDASAWTALVQRYQRLVYAIVMRAGPDEHVAADVFQTVFSRLLIHLPRLDEPQRLQAWIVTTTKRETLLQCQRSRRMVSLQRVPEEGQEREAGTEWDAVDEALLPEEALSQLQQAVRVRAALERLDERCRRLLMLLFAGDNERPAYDEVSRRMDMPVGSIGPTRARCLAKLRPWLD